MTTKIMNVVISISALGLIVMLFISVLVIGSEFYFRQYQEIQKGSETAEIVVKPGDTLWSIVQTQMPDVDPRIVIAQIREINQLESAKIFPGQILEFPKQGPVRFAAQPK